MYSLASSPTLESTSPQALHLHIYFYMCMLEDNLWESVSIHHVGHTSNDPVRHSLEQNYLSLQGVGGYRYIPPCPAPRNPVNSPLATLSQSKGSPPSHISPQSCMGVSFSNQEMLGPQTTVAFKKEKKFCADLGQVLLYNSP